jgi:Holliday junction DNA helicase RuvA
VQGVGARVALGILGVLAPGDLAQAIMAQDKARLTQAPNVGPKLAGRICGELKDKAGKLAIGPGIAAAAGAGPAAAVAAGDGAAGGVAGDAISALVNLGYGRSEAFAAVQGAIGELGSGADLQTVIRNGLQALAR